MTDGIASQAVESDRPAARRARLLCRVLAVACFALASLQAVMIVTGFVDPVLLTSNFTCTTQECGVGQDMEQLVPEYDRALFRSVPEAGAILKAHLEQTQPRGLYGLSVLMLALPKMLFFLGLGKVFSLASRKRPFTQKLLFWIQVAALSAVAGAIVAPFAASVRSLAVLPALGRPGSVTWLLDVTPFLGSALTAGAIFVAAWAVSQAQGLQDETESFL